MNILFVASECTPFAKTGGLADVVGSLPKALAGLGHDVRVILPRYRQVDLRAFGLQRCGDPLPISVGGRVHQAGLFQATLPGTAIPVYFVDVPALFDREGLYQERGADYSDNLERFSVFIQAALRGLPSFGWRPDVVHAHDWQAALICPHLASSYASEPFWQHAQTVLTIHNLAYQGVFPYADWPLTGLPSQAWGIEGLEFYGRINCLKGGLVFADTITTVSPTYAKEIQTPEYGCGLEGVVASRREDLRGILNGIDVDEWNPRTDPHLPAHYSLNEMAGKALCKLALQESQELPQRHGPVIGMIQRLVGQKGTDIFVKAAPDILRGDVQIVILGSGDPAYHEQLKALEAQFPDRLSVNLTFDNALAHQIEAGADAFLMPSRFEPCGLNQMYSMRYGTVPIVRRVGGLADTVIDVTPQTAEAGEATGFVFDAYSSAALTEAVRRAVAAFEDHGLWHSVVRAGMQRDDSWTRSAREYVSVYEQARSNGGRLIAS